MVKKFIHHPVLAFFILVLVVVIALWIWAPATFHPSAQATLRDRLSCQTDKFSTALLDTTLAKTSGQIKLLVSFDHQPDNDTAARNAAQGTQLYLDSWVFDYLVAETTQEHLCDLARESQISFIDIVPSL